MHRTFVKGKFFNERGGTHAAAARQKLGFAAIPNAVFYTGEMLLFVQFSFHRL